MPPHNAYQNKLLYLPNNQNIYIMSKNNQMSKDEAIKSASIMHAIEIDSAFKLYSYRIISHEQYVARVQNLVQLFNQNLAAHNDD